MFSEIFEAHLLHLRQVLERFKVAGLKLKPSKCHFFSQTVEYLGHLVTPQGILPNPNRVSPIKEFPAPKSVKEVRKFLGLGSYYRRFMHNFAEIAHPLHRKMRSSSGHQSVKRLFNNSRMPLSAHLY